MQPRISICVPNLNTRRFLPERFETIFGQSRQDWELLVYDSYSSDGSWEYICTLASREPRMRAWQGPREGTPGSWSPCVREANGEYVYIATSDDTMAADCLERLASALDSHPECEIAHCPLRPIDEHGRDLWAKSGLWRNSPFALSSGPLLNRVHVRKAPFDGLLHLLGGSVYTSITQLLIRRSLFERIGLFSSTWGSVGDFNWSMRAGLVANTVHVPDTWAGWRQHGAQATAGVQVRSDEHARKIDEMIENAIAASGPLLSPAIRCRLTDRWSAEARDLRAFTREVARRRTRSFARRSAFIAACALTGSRPAREYATARLLGRPAVDWVRRRLAETGCEPLLLVD